MENKSSKHPTDGILVFEEGPTPGISPRTQNLLDLLQCPSSVINPVLSAFQLRAYFERDCVSDFDIESLLHNDLIPGNADCDRVNVHIASCARCVDRVHMIGEEFQMTHDVLTRIAPEPACDGIALDALLDDVGPISAADREHLRHCAPCRAALRETFMSPEFAKPPVMEISHQIAERMKGAQHLSNAAPPFRVTQRDREMCDPHDVADNAPTQNQTFNKLRLLH